MAPVEDGKEEEEEIEIQDEEAEQDAEQSPFESPEIRNFQLRKTSRTIAARTSRSANGAGTVCWVAVVEILISAPQDPTSPSSGWIISSSRTTR